MQHFFLSMSQKIFLKKNSLLLKTTVHLTFHFYAEQKTASFDSVLIGLSVDQFLQRLYHFPNC